MVGLGNDLILGLGILIGSSVVHELIGAIKDYTENYYIEFIVISIYLMFFIIISIFLFKEKAFPPQTLINNTFKEAKS